MLEQCVQLFTAANNPMLRKSFQRNCFINYEFAFIYLSFVHCVHLAVSNEILHYQPYLIFTTDVRSDATNTDFISFVLYSQRSCFIFLRPRIRILPATRLLIIYSRVSVVPPLKCWSGSLKCNTTVCVLLRPLKYKIQTIITPFSAA